MAPGTAASLSPGDLLEILAPHLRPKSNSPSGATISILTSLPGDDGVWLKIEMERKMVKGTLVVGGSQGSG